MRTDIAVGQLLLLAYGRLRTPYFTPPAQDVQHASTFMFNGGLLASLPEKNNARCSESGLSLTDNLRWVDYRGAVPDSSHAGGGKTSNAD